METKNKSKRRNSWKRSKVEEEKKGVERIWRAVV